MKLFNSLSLVALLVALLAGCGPNGNRNQDTTNAPMNDQNTQTEIPKANGNNEPVDLEQRTGIPFQIRHASQDTLPLLGIMINLEQNLAVVQAGIWRGDYQTISKAANALANHAKIPKREVQKIQAILGKDGLKNFVAADEYWHNKANELARVADEKNMEQIVDRTMELIDRCASCHTTFRGPLRDSPKWLNR